MISCRKCNNKDFTTIDLRKVKFKNETVHAHFYCLICLDNYHLAQTQEVLDIINHLPFSKKVPKSEKKAEKKLRKKMALGQETLF